MQSEFEKWQSKFISDSPEAGQLMAKATNTPIPATDPAIPADVGGVANPLDNVDLGAYSDKPVVASSSDITSYQMYQNSTSKAGQSDTLKIFQALESGGKNLKPNSSGYEGVYQFRYRQGDLGTRLAKEMGVTPDQVRASGDLQQKMMERALSEYRSNLTKNGLAVNDLNLYIVHNQGLGGTKAIFNTLNKGAKLTPTIRRNILNQFGNSEKVKLKLHSLGDKALAQAYYNKFSRKVRQYSSGVSSTKSSNSSNSSNSTVKTARLMIGAKYSYGASPMSTNKADCSSLTKRAVSGKIAIPRTAQGQYDFFKKKGKLTMNRSKAKAGDLVYFDFKNSNGNAVGHTAVITKNSGGKLRIIEASGGNGKVIERDLPASYYKHIVGIGLV